MKRIALVFLFLAAFISPLQAAPAAWQVKGEDGTLIVFGTMHRLPEGMPWFSEALQDGLNTSRLLVLETESSQASEDYLAHLLRQPGVAIGSRPLNKRLEPADYQKLLERIEANGLTERDVVHYRPWYAALLLARISGEEAGLERALGVEDVLTDKAGELEIDIIGLESPAQQFSFFSGLPRKVEVAWLEKILRRTDPPGSRSERLYQSWISGDLEALEDQVLGSLKETPGLYDVLIKKRNRTWADQLEFLLDAGGQVFVALGTAHMVGRDSVLLDLEERGFEVTRIQ